MKKITCLFMVFVLLCGVLGASAAGKVEISSSSVVGKAGDTLKLTIDISAGANAGAATIVLRYNPATIEVEDAKEGELISGALSSVNHIAEQAKVIVTFATLDGVNSAGSLAEISMKILNENVQTNDIKLFVPELVDVDVQPLECTVVQGSVLLADELNSSGPPKEAPEDNGWFNSTTEESQAPSGGGSGGSSGTPGNPSGGEQTAPSDPSSPTSPIDPSEQPDTADPATPESETQTTEPPIKNSNLLLIILLSVTGAGVIIASIVLVLRAKKKKGGA